MVSITPHVIQVIQEIKNSVDKPHRCGWIENLQSDEVKRATTRRYRDGAVKIMDLLRPELTARDIDMYQQHYDVLHDLPDIWVNDRLAAAKALWEYVLSVDERLSHARITSSSNSSPPGRRDNSRRADEPARRVRIETPRPQQSTESTSDTQLVTRDYSHPPWWAISSPSIYYVPSWVSYSPPAFVHVTPLGTFLHRPEVTDLTLRGIF
ncbi:hypothetical protein BD414DRAFT_412500 [Trametes punicea]|nr:hypothetical protein BD414DRAFT_412500 [Trametes punicea]